MKAPDHLSHKPIVAVHDYEQLDDHFGDGTDAKALSIGKAQYGGNNELSAKIWRYDEEHGWKRQSEEMPLHRVLDLAILIAACYGREKGQRFPTSTLREVWANEEEADFIQGKFDEMTGILEPRFAELKRLIDQMA